MGGSRLNEINSLMDNRELTAASSAVTNPLLVCRTIRAWRARMNPSRKWLYDVERTGTCETEMH